MPLKIEEVCLFVEELDHSEAWLFILTDPYGSVERAAGYIAFQRTVAVGEGRS